MSVFEPLCQISINKEIKLGQWGGSGRGRLPDACWWELLCKGIGAIKFSLSLT